MGIPEKVAQVRARIKSAARAAGRNPAQVRLVAVTKKVPVERIREAIRCGVLEIGENRVQEAQEKRALVGDSVRWHLIGQLQRNKVKFAVELFDAVHSVDSAPLSEALEAQSAQKRTDPLEVWLQVNVSAEAAKSGCRPEEAEVLAGEILKAKHLKLAGLMTMAPLSGDPEAARPHFKQLRKLRDDFQRKFDLGLGLSMGMSLDFETAIQEGATVVRVGTAIFGER